MSEKAENPRAFPFGIDHGSQYGMDLLTYLAGQALAGYGATSIIYQDATRGQLAAWAYETAEAMLVERAKRMKEREQ